MPPRTAHFFSLFTKDPLVAAESPTHGAFLKSSLLLVPPDWPFPKLSSWRNNDWVETVAFLALSKPASLFEPYETHSQTIKLAKRWSGTLELNAVRWIPHIWHWWWDLLLVHSMWGRLANDLSPLSYYLWPGGMGPWLPGRWINPIVGGPLAQKAGEHHKVS